MALCCNSQKPPQVVFDRFGTFENNRRLFSNVPKRAKTTGKKNFFISPFNSKTKKWNSV